MPRAVFFSLVPLLLASLSYAETAAPDAVPPKEKAVSHSASKGPPKHTNALAKETSPYLLQHAHNPVNWYPWGPEAFEKARKEDKPVFLSIGYSSCHWCHVMERESFEKEDAAEILNKHFISIKVDREERPDVDEIYMTAVQLVSGHGGWPMSVFMTSEGKPFFAGTYFPPEDRHGRMGFKSLLKKVNEVWGNQRADVLKDANHLSESVQQRLGRGRIPADGQLNAALLDNFVNEMHESFDVKYGGFGTRPKFPPNNGLPLLLHLQQQKKTDNKILQMTRVTLEQMALGGIHDHLGGGFHRYSTDQFWLLPHFEKMLYDNAMLSRSYALASVVYNEPEYARIARGVYDWVLREMTSPDGGFYSTLDADSEGHEGKFYVWDKKEIDQLLGADAAAFNAIFNIHEKGNFREEATGEDTGLNIPHMTEALENHAKRLKLTEDELRGKINGWKATLLAVRIKRVWPGLDDKILTAWNALMISSFARGSIWLNEPRYKAAAVAAAEFALKNQRTKDGRWLATHRKGESKLPAYLDDHAFLAVAFLDLFDATNDARWKEEAVAIVKLMDEHFADDQGGGYFFTADDHEKLLARTKDPVDKAIPSGNGWAAQALVRLAKLTGDQKYRDKAAELFEEFHGLMEKAPQATESLLLAFANHLEAGGAAPAKKPASTEAKAKVQKGPVIVELFAARSALRAGAETPIAVRLSVDEGWHIQAHGEKNLAETKIVLASDDLGTLKNEKYPDAKTLSAPELGGDLKVYEGAAIVSAQLAVPANAPLGKQTLKVKVKFQACNDKVCEKPEEAILSLSIDVVAKDADVTPTNGKIFDDLK